jgi:rubrerythrin
MVGNLEIRDRLDFQVASGEYDKLLKAKEAAVRCEMCAVSIMYDSECPYCKITYKDGEPLHAQSK